MPLRHLAALVAAVVILGGVGVLLYRSIIPGLSSARREPPAAEVSVATWLLHESVPADARAQINPLGKDPPISQPAKTSSGRNAPFATPIDGSGKTEIGAGEYPRPPALRSMNIMALTDGEMFYHIRNGIRNTGMPAWSMPDEQVWQTVAYLRHLPAVAALSPEPMPGGETRVIKGAHYVGSSACQSCHSDIYDRWKKTRMANVVRDPKDHPEAIIPDLSKPDPLVTFTKDDIAFVYGSKWKQRYFKKVGDDYFPLPAQWDVTHQIWRKYFVPNGRGLVGAVLPGRQHAAADRPAMRRLSFGELRHRDQDADRVERRMRALSWAGQRACREARSGHHRQSRPSRLSCTRTTPASNVIRRGGRSRIRSRANIMTGRSDFTSA